MRFAFKSFSRAMTRTRSPASWVDGNGAKPRRSYRTRNVKILIHNTSQKSPLFVRNFVFFVLLRIKPQSDKSLNRYNNHLHSVQTLCNCKVGREEKGVDRLECHALACWGCLGRRCSTCGCRENFSHDICCGGIESAAGID